MDGDFGCGFPARTVWNVAGYRHSIGVCWRARNIAPGDCHDPSRGLCRDRVGNYASDDVCIDEKRHCI